MSLKHKLGKSGNKNALPEAENKSRKTRYAVLLFLFSALSCLLYFGALALAPYIATYLPATEIWSVAGGILLCSLVFVNFSIASKSDAEKARPDFKEKYAGRVKASKILSLSLIAVIVPLFFDILILAVEELFGIDIGGVF